MEGEAGRKLGDANLAYATHDFPTAIELLREVIRLAPNNPDPYQTLGMIYEELAGDEGNVHVTTESYRIKPPPSLDTFSKAPLTINVWPYRARPYLSLAPLKSNE